MDREGTEVPCVHEKGVKVTQKEEQGTRGLSAIILLLIEIVTGIAVYLILSMLVRPRPFTILYGQLKNFLKKSATICVITILRNI